eukprot:TRINITY_DN7384_c0_g1_i1.p1 TRINITY_DN7384_c0_g1~~TRINITY_DN7384_c0_g1_i1.p1  ORF type:complete len:278 (-),score=67.56 TRINITY_DN7384_c0_g1_i1:710-1543(-)
MNPEQKRLITILGIAAGAALAVGLYFLLPGKKKSLLQHYKEAFSYSKDELQTMITNFHAEMKAGLAGPSTIKMIPSYTGKPTGKEAGIFLSLDLGGTNFRVISQELKGGFFGEFKPKKYLISESLMQGHGEELFNFIAKCVQDFYQQQEKKVSGDAPLGFTFSFPVQQTSINSGTLIQWTKGFTAPHVEGEDIVKLLNDSFKREKIHVEVAALVNDTVGTLLTKSYTDPECEVGVILGTGSNACYVEKGRNIPKLKPGEWPADKDMIINMEWGGMKS